MGNRIQYRDKTQLTQKEIEAWELVQQGLKFKEVAEKLGIATSTVASRVKSVRARLCAREDRKA